MRSMVSAAILAILLAAALFPDRAIAQATTSADSEKSTQKERMASCEADATAANIVGDARKSAISTCLSRKAVGRDNTNAAQEKLKWCNGQADEKNLLDSARRAFIDNCVKGFVL
jgi:hypothetical protein